MSVKFDISPKDLFKGLDKELNRALSKGLDESAKFMKSQFELVFENRGATENERAFGFEMFEPTTATALRGRQTYPSDGSIQERRNYEENADTLVDTGRLRDSIAIEEDNIKNEQIRFVGAGVQYIETHEDGGTITVDGESHDVPARPFQHMTEDEQQNVENLILKEVREAQL
jgi:phage gpG-like protein